MLIMPAIAQGRENDQGAALPADLSQMVPRKPGNVNDMQKFGVNPAG